MIYWLIFRSTFMYACESWFDLIYPKQRRYTQLLIWKSATDNWYATKRSYHNQKFRWFGHVQRMKNCQRNHWMMAYGMRGRGSPRRLCVDPKKIHAAPRRTPDIESMQFLLSNFISQGNKMDGLDYFYHDPRSWCLEAHFFCPEPIFFMLIIIIIYRG